MNKLIVSMLLIFSATTSEVFACTQAGFSDTQCQKVCTPYSSVSGGAHAACMFGNPRK